METQTKKSQKVQQVQSEPNSEKLYTQAEVDKLVASAVLKEKMIWASKFRSLI